MDLNLEQRLVLCVGRKLNNKFKSESLAPKDFNVIFINYTSYDKLKNSF